MSGKQTLAGIYFIPEAYLSLTNKGKKYVPLASHLNDRFCDSYVPHLMCQMMARESLRFFNFCLQFYPYIIHHLLIKIMFSGGDFKKLLLYS